MKKIDVTEEEEAMILKHRKKEKEKEKITEVQSVKDITSILDLNLADLERRVPQTGGIEQTKLEEAIRNAESIVDKLKLLRKEV